MEHIPEIFFLNIRTFEAFCGGCFLVLVYAAALVYILLREKKKWIKLVLGICPSVILLLFFFPPVRLVYDKLLGESATFYRVLWLVPFGLTIAYALVTLFWKHLLIGLIAGCVLVALTGRYVYNNPIVSKAENPYHLRQEVINVVDLLSPHEDNAVLACVPPELVHQLRQYSINITLLYGRESVEPAWRLYSEVYELMVAAERIDMEALTVLLEERGCQYLVLNEERDISAQPQAFEWEEVGRTSGYIIYEAPEKDTP